MDNLTKKKDDRKAASHEIKLELIVANDAANTNKYISCRACWRVVNGSVLALG